MPGVMVVVRDKEEMIPKSGNARLTFHTKTKCLFMCTKAYHGQQKSGVADEFTDWGNNRSFIVCRTLFLSTISSL